MADTDMNSRILGYWAKVEALIAPGAEKHTETIPNGKISYVWDGDLPWPNDDIKLAHKHYVRFGMFPLRAYEVELFKFFEVTKEPPDQRSGMYAGENELTFLGLFEVDQEGLPQTGTLDMAAFAAAFAGLLKKRDVSFDDYKGRIATSFDEAAKAAQESKQPVTRELIQSLVTSAIKFLDWTPPDLDKGPLVVVRTVAIKSESGRSLEASIDPVNGFFFEDICKVQRKIAAEKTVGLVARYLAEPDEHLRTDCTALEKLEAILDVDRLPDGRWPSKHPLTLMQQAAVNQAFAMRSGSQPLFSVNGPPGTGKTTLLMDLVAALVVERAKILCRFENPASAFEKKWEVQYQGYKNPTHVFALDRRLHGFSIVVASSNNGAVENITRELPNLSKLSHEYHGADYFRQLATIYINHTVTEGDGEGENRPDPIEGWGLVSAPLGKKKNRSRFVKTLDAQKWIEGKDGSRKPEPLPHNIFRLLDEAKASTDWGRVRKGFNDAAQKVQNIKAELKSVEALKKALERSEDLVGDSDIVLKELNDTLSRAMADEQIIGREVQNRERRAQDAQNALNNLLPARPAFFARLFNTSSFRSWQKDWSTALKEQRATQQKLNEAHASLEACRKALASLPAMISEAEDELRLRQLEVQRVEAALERVKGDNFVDFADVQKMDPDQREQALPFSNTALHDARAKLFLHAMEVHKAFATSDVFSKNLRRSLEMLDGKRELRPILSEAAIHLWETLFLLVPVVSTTFASMARAFNHLEAGSIGWLLIDEAGQAVPQHAVGALYRSRRAVIVGDPLQIEPVIRFNKKADTTLLGLSRVPISYQSTATSVQVLADGVNPSGAYLRGNWVGCPLRVHRRCIDPMFSISNAIAYEGTMVLGDGKQTEEESRTARSLLGPSRWFDVTGVAGQRENYLPEQGKLALDLIRRFMRDGWVDEHKFKGLPAVFVISPFKSVAQEFERLLLRTQKEWASHISESLFEKWADASVGTVHTFQGKEQESVILLLGGATDGAIRWAAGSPNILNVAVTRGQRRLYVIGDRGRWAQNDLAKCLTHRLPVEEIQSVQVAKAQQA